MFQFDVVNDDQLTKFSLLEDGEYSFSIKSCMDKISSRGNSMMVIEIKVANDSGNEFIIIDYLVNTPAAQFKIKAFCDAIGVDYRKGLLTQDDILNGQGKLLIGSEDYVNKNGDTKKKNVVKDYLPSGEIKVLNTKSKGSEDVPFFDDDVPF